MGIHTVLTHCIATHFFLFSLLFPQRNTESGQGFERKKPHNEAAQDFFSSELAKPLTASQVRSYLCRPKREKNTVRFTNADWSKKPQFLYHLFENSHVNGIVIRLVIDFNQIYTPFHLRNSHYVGDDSGSS